VLDLDPIVLLNKLSKIAPLYIRKCCIYAAKKCKLCKRQRADGFVQDEHFNGRKNRHLTQGTVIIAELAMGKYLDSIHCGPFCGKDTHTHCMVVIFVSNLQNTSEMMYLKNPSTGLINGDSHGSKKFEFRSN
jgi:hypothetical protein